MKRFFIFFLTFLIFPLFSQISPPSQMANKAFVPAEIKNFMRFYPDIEYTAAFDRWYYLSLENYILVVMLSLRSALPQAKDSSTSSPMTLKSLNDK